MYVLFGIHFGLSSELETGDHFFLSKIHSSRPISHGAISYALFQMSLTWDLYLNFTDEIKTAKVPVLDP